MTDGLSRLTALASTSPRSRPAWRSAWVAGRLPPRTRSTTSRPVAAGIPWAASRAATAGPLAMASRQPVLPHRHGASPPCGAWTWPRSPAAPWAPRCSRPSLMMPAPMPVATLTKTMWSSRAPRSPTSPRTRSPSAITFTSLSTSTGQPRPAPTTPGTSKPSQPGMIGGLVGRPVECSTGPGRPMPTPQQVARGRRPALRSSDLLLRTSHFSTASGPSEIWMSSVCSASTSAVERGDGEPGVRGPDVGTDDDPGAGVEPEPGGRAAAGGDGLGDGDDQPAARPARRAAARPWTGPARWPR